MPIEVDSPGARPTPLRKAFAVLEHIADRGGASAKDISDALGYPIPTVYRLARSLVATGYLVHLKDDSRFELGYKPHQLAVSLHRQIGVPTVVKTAIAELHRRLDMAAYFAINRGADVVIAFVADSARRPRLSPLGFGLHEAAHATAFGKIMLAAMDQAQRNQYLLAHGTRPFQPNTISEGSALAADLDQVILAGIAWEVEEFLPGVTCAAVGVRNPAGMVVGSVAVSAKSTDMFGLEKSVETELRETANLVSRYLRNGTSR